MEEVCRREGGKVLAGLVRRFAAIAAYSRACELTVNAVELQYLQSRRAELLNLPA